MNQDLTKHAGEVLGNLSANKYEVSDSGIHFPSMGAMASGVYTHDVNGLDERVDSNLLVDEGLLYMLTVSLYNGTKLPTWYLALYSANYTPTAGLTAASFPATATEITSLSEGYSETTRPTWVASAPAANLVDNMASKAAFTIVTASTLTVNGAALSSDATRGAVTGKLMSATKFAAARTLYNTDVFNLAYRVQLTST